jgi:hypothetical protein
MLNVNVLEPEHVLCTDNIQVNINVRLIIARVLTSILAHSRYLTRRDLSTSGNPFVHTQETNSKTWLMLNVNVKVCLIPLSL